MKRIILTLMLSWLCVGAAWGDEVGISIRLGHPNFFGEIEVGDQAPPPVVRERPILIRHARHGERLAPIYLRVPPHHARNWSRYCARYGACNRPVYFVNDDWYTNEYAPRYRERHYETHHDEHHDAGDDRDHDHRDHDHDHDHRDNNGNGDHGNDHHHDHQDH